VPAEVFGNLPSAVVTSGGTTAPVSGTTETWTVLSSAAFPAVSASALPATQVHVADIALNAELITVTNISGTTWTVTRGAEGTVPVPHSLPFTACQVTSAGVLTAFQAAYGHAPDWLNVVTMYGADPSGTADSSAAIQAAITSAQAYGGTVYFPAGTYYSASTPLSVTAPMRLTGTSGSVLRFAGSGGINFGNSYISPGDTSPQVGLQIDNLCFDVTGGDIFYNCNWNNFWLHDLRLIQRSAGQAVWSCSGSVSILAGLVSNVVSDVFGATRSVPAWNLVSSIGGGIALLTFINCHFGNKNSDSTQFFAWIEGNGTHDYTCAIKWLGCTFDKAFGGAVKALSAKYWSFDTCQIIDTFGGTPGNSMFYVGASAGGSQYPSEHVAFRDCSRDLQGPNGSTTWDIECESTCDSITVDSYGVRDIPGVSVFHPQFNFHGCTNVLVSNCPDAVITGTPASYVYLGPNGNISYTGSLTGAAFPDTTLPGDLGYLAWTYDPAMTAGGGTTATAGTVYLAAVYVRGTIIVNNLYFALAGAATGATSAQNWIGLYTSSGTLLGSVDVTSSLGTTNKPLKGALGSPLNLDAGFYWVAVVFNTSTTQPQLLRSNNTNIGNLNGQLATSALRYTSNGTSQTSLPSPVTPSGNSATIAIGFWAALS
jgi:hypothetical protein